MIVNNDNDDINRNARIDADNNFGKNINCRVYDKQEY